MSATHVEITKDEALAAVRAGAFECEPEPEAATCGHPGCTDHPGQGRKIVHCRMSFTGADWDLASVEEEIRDATQVVWTDSGGHDLGVLSGGKVYRFGVNRPADVLPRGAA